VSAAGKASAKTVNPLGLVAKDGSIYLVASEGLSGKPRNYPLQRVKEASASQHRLEEPLGFNLDRYIEETHQLSHVLNSAESPLTLKLRVSPNAIHHFRERPLAVDQMIGTVADSGDWHVVTATVPDTILLVPFLVSMGPWIEVLEPAAVRARTFQWLRDTCAMYQSQG
jgi:predicted DNA-binding transcriptional regulator YafY